MKDQELEKILEEGFDELAEEIAQRVGDYEDHPGLSKEKEQQLFAEIRRREEARKAAEVKRPVRHFSRKYVLILAAALVLTLAAGMSALGDRFWMTQSTDVEREAEISTKVNNEEKESILTETEEIYREIEEALGIAPMWFGYLPKGTVLDDYEILEEAGIAYLYFTYGEKIIKVAMSKKNKEMSWNTQFDGGVEQVDYSSQAYEVELYRMKEEPLCYFANIRYGNGYYFIVGSTGDEIFKILDYIFFKNL
ncbi:MAG: DUF4367 domain-containing protein [Lachnospiraceae bacterium]